MSPEVSSAATSCGSAVVCFAAETLPVVQWIAGAVAIIAGVVAVLWTAYKFLKLRKSG